VLERDYIPSPGGGLYSTLIGAQIGHRDVIGLALHAPAPRQEARDRYRMGKMLDNGDYWGKI
jgi:hypothetical protein